MKTNVVMIRKMGEFEVTQRTSDGMFNATSLLNQWNISNGMQKEVTKFYELEQTKAFIEVLVNEEKLNTHNLAYVKSKASRGNNAGTWMHPILFIKFAMWINPKFEYYVIKFVYDQLIKYRHDAGDNYRGLTGAISYWPDVNYPQLAKALNYVVFGKHESDLRQNASESQLKELTLLQQKLSFAVDMGYIKTFDELMNELRKIWGNHRITCN